MRKARRVGERVMPSRYGHGEKAGGAIAVRGRGHHIFERPNKMGDEKIDRTGPQNERKNARWNNFLYAKRNISPQRSKGSAHLERQESAWSFLSLSFAASWSAAGMDVRMMVEMYCTV